MTAAPAERTRHRVLIVGGGFAGLYAARNLSSDPEVAVTLSTGATSTCSSRCSTRSRPARCRPGDIAQPLRSVLSRQRNATVILGEAVGIDVDKREVQVSTAARSRYDTLIVATGAHHTYFGHDDWAHARARAQDARGRDSRSGAASSSRSRPRNGKPIRSGGASG